jgi:hypothetical protein
VQLPFVAQWLAGELASPSSEPVVHM